MPFCDPYFGNPVLSTVQKTAFIVLLLLGSSEVCCLALLLTLLVFVNARACPPCPSQTHNNLHVLSVANCSLDLVAICHDARSDREGTTLAIWLRFQRSRPQINGESAPRVTASSKDWIRTFAPVLRASALIPPSVSLSVPPSSLTRL